MESFRQYPAMVFVILGFFFYGQLMNVFILAIIWELVDDCLDKGVSPSNIAQHFSEYQRLWKQDDLSKQNKIIDLGTNMGAYYLGHFIRNKLPV